MRHLSFIFLLVISCILTTRSFSQEPIFNQEKNYKLIKKQHKFRMFEYKPTSFEVTNLHETNRYLQLNKNGKFYYSADFGEGLEIILEGNWKDSGDYIVTKNNYTKFLVEVELEDSCTTFLPDLINKSKKKLDKSFFITIDEMPDSLFDIGMLPLIPYTSLYHNKKIMISSSNGNAKTDWFYIPFKDCYHFFVKYDFNPSIYLWDIDQIVFLKKRNNLIFIKYSKTNS